MARTGSCNCLASRRANRSFEGLQAQLSGADLATLGPRLVIGYLRGYFRDFAQQVGRMRLLN